MIRPASEDLCPRCGDYLRDCLCDEENTVCHYCGNPDCFVCDICEETWCNCDCD